MHENRLRNKILISVYGVVLMSAAQAGKPLWTFAQVSGYPSSVSVSSTEVATIKYTVTNQSHKSHQLQMKPIHGINASGCTSALDYHQSCTLNISVTGSALKGDVTGGPVLCDQDSRLQCYQPSQTDSLAIRFTQQTSATLTPSETSLALSVNCQPGSLCSTTQNAALTGNSRQIAIQNTGTTIASNVLVRTSGLPSGTTISSNTCSGTLNTGSTCLITLTPGHVASVDPGSNSCTSGTQPVAGTVIITADGDLSTQVSVYVLSYGCQYQGGFIYSIDDETLNTGSIGGKVAALTDQSAGVIWSSNGNSSVSDVAILGIDELSTINSPSPTIPAYPSGTPPYVACNGKSDGACNTSNIVSYYNFSRTTGGLAPTPLEQYAAGLCKATINGQSDWYLPAICEEGYDDIGSGANGCGTQISPTLQNMLSNLFDANVGALSGEYWSSTEWSGGTAEYAWNQTFDPSRIQNTFAKSYSNIYVRCSRSLTF